MTSDNRTGRMWRWLRVALASASLVALTLTVAGVWHATWLLGLQVVGAVVGLSVSALVAVVVLTLLSGRSYCSVICPLGIWMDLSRWLARLAGRSSSFHFMPQRVRHVAAPVVVALAVVAWWMGIYYIVGLVDPFAVYSRAVVAVEGSFASLPAAGSHLKPVFNLQTAIFTVAPALLATVSAVVWGRALCHLVCPVGYVLGWMSRRPLYGVRVDASRCAGCGRCETHCASSCLDAARGKIDRSRCVACMDCVAACPAGALRVGLLVSRTRHEVDGSDHARRTPSPECASPEVRRAARQSTVDGSSVVRPLIVAAAGAAAVRAVAQDEEEVWSDGQTQYVTRRLHGERTVHGELNGQTTVDRYEAIMPPCTVSRERFQSRCVACHACIAACPQHILRAAVDEYGEGGRMQPMVSYELGWCRPDCNRCAEVCPTGAIRLLPLADKAKDRLGWANYNSRTCVTATEGVDCDACVRHCPTRAITMVTQNGHRMPRIRVSLCTGCGACEYYCPARPKAIYVEGLKW